MDQRLLLFFLAAAALLISIPDFFTLTGAQSIGVNYGLKGGNLPPPAQVIPLYQSRNINKVRLFNPDDTVLKALEGSGINVVLGTLNEDLQQLAGSDGSYAASWVKTNVIPHAGAVNFSYITAGNEVIPGDLAGFVLPAMRNLDTAVKAANLTIPVTTAIATNVLGTSYPPSQGAFSNVSSPIMAPIAAFLAANKAPLLVNVYPYFAYFGNENQVRLDYALFTASGVVVPDGTLGYSNLFDAMVDSVYAAMEKAGAPGVELVVSETGWPSGGGGDAATVQNAMTYNNNLVANVVSKKGTPRRPGKAVEAYLFAMFNENQKPEGTEQHFGLYQPDMTEVYHVAFNT